MKYMQNTLDPISARTDFSCGASDKISRLQEAPLQTPESLLPQIKQIDASYVNRAGARRTMVERGREAGWG